MRTWKFMLPVTDLVELDMPAGAKVLTVQAQGNGVSMWALVDPDAPTERREFRIYGTGHLIREPGEYIATFQTHEGTLVFHVFELAKK